MAKPAPARARRQDAELEVRYRWNQKQGQLILIQGQVGGHVEYINLEGAIRAGKSTPCCVKLCDYATRFPGIHMAATRWTQDGLNAMVRPLWRDTAKAHGLKLKWHGDEEYDEVIGYGSRVYLRALRSSDNNAKYSKLAGLTLSVLWIDQPEELNGDIFYAYVPARLSQVGYPHECWLTPNPPGNNHWLTTEFPTNAKPKSPYHHFIHTTVYDNQHVLGDSYIEDLESMYPVGTWMRRRFIDGRRGLTPEGVPVYKGYYSPKLHEQEIIEINPELPLLEGWDFGHHHPCVVWGQFLPWGAFHLLGGVMGEGMFIEDFCPAALQLRNQWFGGRVLEVKTTGDPAGGRMNSMGTNRNAADVLTANGLILEVIPGANHVMRRDTAVKATGGYMQRLTSFGPALQVARRFMVIGRNYTRVEPVLTDALEAGYVWHDTPAMPGSPSVRSPKKDGYYDHPMNCVEYIVLKHGPALDATVNGKAKPKQEMYPGLRPLPKGETSWAS